MASKVLLATFILVCVGVCHGHRRLKHPQGDASSNDPEHVCTGECPEFELLCWTPEYDVRRYKSALWVSTTMSDLSLSKASGRGRKRLHDYFGGANDKRLKMTYTGTMVTQTRMPSESPVREITVAMPLPKKVAKHPPKPTDPRVVIDLVPEAIMYVKTFRGRSSRVGFVADLEAKKFFKTLKANNEPLHENDGYYYVPQYSSSEDSHGHGRRIHTEIAIFAMNEKTYKWLEFNDLTTRPGQGLPTECLRGDGEPMVWEKMDQSDIPMLTREQCSTTYCQAPKKCPKVETKDVKGIDDKTIQLKNLKDIKALAYVPPTCYYDTAIHASATPLLEALNTSDISPSEVAMKITVAMEKREELDGEKSCQKFFKVLFATGGGKGGQEDIQMKEETGLHTPKTVEAIHQGLTISPSYYSKCFGGNAYYEPTTITSTAKMLMERLRDKKKCFLGDHISVVEYHPQSRMFDRYNEINLDADLDCSDQEGRPPFTFHLPVSKDYSRTEARPSLGDRCDTHECEELSVIMKLKNNLKIIDYKGEKWIYAKGASESCSYPEAFEKALNSLLSYLNGKNEDNSTIDMTTPLYIKVVVLREDEGRFFRFMFKGNVRDTRQHLLEVFEELDGLKPFGVDYDAEGIYLGAYDSIDKEDALFEVAIALKTASKDEQNKTPAVDSDEKELKEDTSDGKVALPKPEGCSEIICPTVYVIKDHSNFMELLLPNRRSVCLRTKLCGDPQTSGRQLIRPIRGYFNGDNSANEKVIDFAVPLFKVRVYSAEEEEKGIAPCEREYQACVRLPDDKEIPEPNGKGMSIFTATRDFHGYGIAVKGHVSEAVASKATSTLMKTLDKENVPYDKACDNCRLFTWVAYFSYDEPLSNPKEKITYFLFIKKGEDIGEGPAKGDSNETEG
ncbi:HEBP2 [Branchiostoma lanceolatum]|uniref:HEBP2 protein n=1 Tax=Branchiostoma lanceolatum TaxID=7740 RepID=A0A8K0EZG1_BRALA|nr:HEBP2 [Branchiostoma lanceolatum]